jgi:hypothetical protein
MWRVGQLADCVYTDVTRPLQNAPFAATMRSVGIVALRVAINNAFKTILNHRQQQN